MSGVHKNPTISFRVSDREREQIDAKIIASGMSKKDYFIRSCIYNRISGWVQELKEFKEEIFMNCQLRAYVR